jgi:predicted alpha/beta-hydrolase family hydrolase
VTVPLDPPLDPPPELDVPTPVGTARAVVEGEPGRGRLLLGHGAGGGVEAPDLLAARDAALRLGLQVVRVVQPWRVAGRRVAEAPVRLDAAWTAVVAALPAAPGPLLLGGRSAGARVACRTATALGADGVLALAFPFRPPGRPDRDRAAELLLPDAPRLVVQGERDAFDVPPASPGVRVHVVAGADHAFAVRRRDGRTAADLREELERVVAAWLAERLGPAGQTVT